MPPQNNSSTLNPDFNMPQISIGTNQTQNIESTRLQFSLDVKPEQKDAYRSDQINQKDDTKTNGYIPRVQGIKNPGEKMSSVWPKVRVSEIYEYFRSETAFFSFTLSKHK
jgi:hypothetical protein